MISFWFVLANTVGFLIWLRFVFIHDDSGMPMIRPHPYSHYSFWIFIVGLPILVVILGILGYLPGTRKKKLEI
jgi:membrane protein DedA with SNARE-associated domain